MNNYPPGVTGNEYEIAGPDREEKPAGVCPRCGEYELWQLFYRNQVWYDCAVCRYHEDLYD